MWRLLQIKTNVTLLLILNVFFFCIFCPYNYCALILIQIKQNCRHIEARIIFCYFSPITGMRHACLHRFLGSLNKYKWVRSHVFYIIYESCMQNVFKRRLPLTTRRNSKPSLRMRADLCTIVCCTESYKPV